MSSRLFIEVRRSGKLRKVEVTSKQYSQIIRRFWDRITQGITTQMTTEETADLNTILGK